MKVLQIGYEKMGGIYLCGTKKNSMVTELVVSDLKIQQPYEQDNVRFVGDISGFNISEFDCAIVSATATFYAQLSYYLRFQHSNALLRLTSSFRA